MRLVRPFLNRRLWKKAISLTLAAAMLPGCSGGQKKITYLGEAELGYYQDSVMQIDQPAVDEPTPDVVAATKKPRKLGDRSKDEIWDLSLAEAIHLALINNKILRVRGDFRTAGSAIYTNADGVPSVFDPAIRDSGVLFGGRGVEAALSQFDPIFNTQMLWGHNSAIQNNLFLSGGVGTGTQLNVDTGAFTTGVTKNLGFGGNIAVSNNINYQFSNAAAQLFPSVYTGNILAQYTQPLLAGAGTEYTRIAGPFNTQIQGVSGVNQGVIISRINTDLAVADFEVQVRNTLRDVEETYWDLYLAYRTHDANVKARNSFLRSYRFAKTNKEEGRFSELEVEQARESYFQGRAAAEDALQNLYNLETQLRRLCGLPSADGRIIRPQDDPSTGEFIPDWNISVAEALTRREELRRQKWNIKSLELQLRAAESLVRPQLNFISSYQVNGYGNNLFNIKGIDTTKGRNGEDLQSYFNTLTSANQQGYTVGLQFNMPLGFRQALSQVRNYELRLAKAREALAMQELEICHELTTTFQNMAWRYQTAQTNYNRWQNAELQVPRREELVIKGRPGFDTSVLLDQWLQTRNRAAQAEISFYTSMIEYQKAITDLHFRKGTLLELNNVHLQEGMWTPEAYADALRRAWARSFAFDAFDADPVHTEPEEFERGSTLGQVQFIDPAANPAAETESGEPADLTSKTPPLALPGPAKSEVPDEAPLPEEVP
jgi:outer membrane protein TolC